MSGIVKYCCADIENRNEVAVNELHTSDFSDPGVSWMAPTAFASSQDLADTPRRRI
jgi:hypothetical protein